MSRKVPQNVYILTRIFGNPADSAFKNKLVAAIKSVAENRKRLGQSAKIIFLVYDDSISSGSFINLFKEEGFTKESGTLNYTKGTTHKGSASSLWELKKTFIDITEKTQDDSAIAIILDQDDKLRPNAVRHIINRIPKNGIVLSSFHENDKKALGTLDVAEKHHNKLIWRLRFNCKRGINQRIACASSLCWTKAYSRGALIIYYEQLKAYLEKARTGEENYFLKHPVYEDFIDYYILLRKDVPVGVTLYPTHIYTKHDASITTNPSLKDFLHHRTAHLVTLIDLAYNDTTKLDEDWKIKLFRYVSIKTMYIERILAKYRSEFEEGNVQRAIFSEKTHNGYFINKFYRLAIGKRRDSGEDDDLFDLEAVSRDTGSKDHFCDLFSCERLKSIGSYNADELKDIKYADNKFVLQLAVEQEGKIYKAKNGAKKDTEKELFERYGIRNTPNRKRQQFMLGISIAWGLTLPLYILIISIPDSWWLYSILHPVAVFFNGASTNVKAAAVTLYGTLLTYLLKRWSDIRLLATEEISQMKLYFSEFEDLIRHLEANLKVMIQIVKRLDKEGLNKPADIHMANLAWPSTSFLFSDDFAKIINKERVDDFARLKVNLRNINNSSQWLSEFVKTETDSAKLIEAINWEIARHFGYLVNFKYLKDSGFHFAKQEELDKYINENKVRNSLTSLFMDYYSDEAVNQQENVNEVRLDLVEKYIQMYYDDRRMKRNVLVY